MNRGNIQGTFLTLHQQQSEEQSAALLLALPAQYAEQGLCNCWASIRPSVHQSVPLQQWRSSFDTMRAVPSLQPSNATAQRLVRLATTTNKMPANCQLC